MKTSGNTILITGGGSGIGRGLAESFHVLGNRVIVAGRRLAALEATMAANPGIEALTFDISDAASIRAFAAEVINKYPGLNVLMNNAGIMRRENLLAQREDLADAEAIVATNLLGPMRLTAALLPHLTAQPEAALVNVSSGLAFVPLHQTPAYCATKAGLHSWTQSLRYQLRGSTTEVIELIPPYVATDLMDGASDPRAMPLDRFIAEVMRIFSDLPESREICVENVKRLRFAADRGQYDEVFYGLNDAFAKHPH